MVSIEVSGRSGLDKLSRIISRLQSKEMASDIGFDLARRGESVAASALAMTRYDGEHDYNVQSSKTDKGGQIVLSGWDVPFIEYGAGVAHSGSRNYGEWQSLMPEGVLGFGEYGHGYGKNPTWSFTNSDGERVVTTGNDAANAIPSAATEMKEEAPNAVRRELGID